MVDKAILGGRNGGSKFEFGTGCALNAGFYNNQKQPLRKQESERSVIQVKLNMTAI